MSGTSTGYGGLQSLVTGSVTDSGRPTAGSSGGLLVALHGGALVGRHVRLRRRGPGELQRARLAGGAEGFAARRVVEQGSQRGADAVDLRLGVGHRVPAHLG